MNKIFLIGNVGQSPEVKTVGESKVATFSIGVTERGYTKKDGSRVEDKTTWFNCQVWRGLAEVVEKFVKKGDKLNVVGSMTSRKYEKDGVEHTAWEVNVTDLELLTPKGASGNDTPAQKPTAQVKSADEIDSLPF